MRELRSFRDVIENQFFSVIESAINEYVSDNLGRLDLRSYRVQQAEEFFVSDLHIKRVDVSDAPGEGIRFDVIVEADMEVAETMLRDREIDEVSEWFRISCRGSLHNGLHDLEITNINTYNREASGGIGRLTDHLVPVIAKEQFDAVASEFLEGCGLGQFTTDPMPIPVQEVAERMGLTIRETRLSRHLTIFGAMVFNDCEIEYYNASNRAYEPMSVKRGTILIDPNIYFMRSLGCLNNTVIHECIHWFKHRKYHELVRMYDDDAARISCQVDECNRYYQSANWTPEDWMEWHANGIAPRVLMPKEAAIKKIEELIKQHELLLGVANRLAIMEGVLFELADFFEVSRQAAKIRMLDLGYMDVEGVATYIDDHYISNYAFAADSKNRNQTFSISLSDSFFEYFNNAEFRQLIDSGNFAYIDGHHVINDPKYVVHSSLGGIDLTDYAKLHVDECCIRFDLKYNPASAADIVVYLDSIEFRKAIPGYNRVPMFNPDGHNLDVLQRSEKLKKFHDEYVAEGSFLEQPTLNFAQTAWAHIERLAIAPKEFCNRTLLSEKTYERLRNNDIPNPNLQTVMQICVGFNLGGVLGEQLLELAGYKLTPQQLAYKKILHSFSEHSIFECDEVLTALGIPSILPKQYRTVV